MGIKDDNSNDKPTFGFGLPTIDGATVQKTLKVLAPTVKRNLLIGELKGNLTQADRAEFLKLFQGSFFKKTAHVVIGDPPQTFKDYQQKFMKKAKEEAAVEKQIADEKKANAERLQKLNALKRKKQEEVRKKQIEKAKKKAEKEKKKALKAAQKKAAEAKKQALLRKKEAEKKKEEEIAKKREAGEEVEDLPPEEEEPEEEEKAEPEEEKKEEEPESEEEKEDEEDPKASEHDAEMAELEKPIKIDLDKSAMELTAEEKKLTFRKLAHPDMTTSNLASAFGSFTLPSKAEGFQEIKFVWSKQPDCEKKLKSWEMTKKAKEFTSKKPEKKEEKKEEVKEEEKKEEGEEVKEEETKEESKEVKKEEEEPEPDIWECSDIQDADGKGRPLYALFQNEDWALVILRYDLHLLVHAWEVDVNDDERPGILEEHLNFYYNKYYKRTFNTTYFGCKTLEELLDLIKGTLS